MTTISKKYRDLTLKIGSDGTRSWWFDGKLHRTDGPAIYSSNGKKIWCNEGECHRTDGPAVEHPDGSKWWYIEGKLYSEEEFKEKLKELK